MHLFLGTFQDNTDDRERKGRNKVRKGAEHAQAKLSWDDVAAIRSSKLTTRELMAIYKVCKYTINDVKRYATYKRPQPPAVEVKP
jgi:hypothetical protein